MISNPELYLMTQLLNLEEVKVIDFVRRERIHNLKFIEKIIKEISKSDIKNVGKEKMI